MQSACEGRLAVYHITKGAVSAYPDLMRKQMKEKGYTCKYCSCSRLVEAFDLMSILTRAHTYSEICHLQQGYALVAHVTCWPCQILD